MKQIDLNEAMGTEHSNGQSPPQWKWKLPWGIEYRAVPVGLVFVTGYATGRMNTQFQLAGRIEFWRDLFLYFFLIVPILSSCVKSEPPSASKDSLEPPISFYAKWVEIADSSPKLILAPQTLGESLLGVGEIMEEVHGCMGLTGAASFKKEIEETLEALKEYERVVQELIEEGESVNSKESWKSADLVKEWDLAHAELGQSLIQVWLAINR